MDIFAVPAANFNLHGRKHIGTGFGCACTLFLWSIMTLFCSEQIMYLVRGTNPQLAFTEETGSHLTESSAINTEAN